jgi:antimicrobial peptide system SdpA family protein
MDFYQCCDLRRGFRWFADAFRTADCNEAVRCVPVSRALFSSLAIIVAGGVLWAAWPQLPSNVMRGTAPLSAAKSNWPYVPLSGANLLGVAFPQGWAFFAQPPNEEQYHVYSRAEPTSLIDRMPYSEPKNLFGLDRRPRKQGRELHSLIERIRGDQWRPCTSDAQCRNATTQPIAVRNHDPNPMYCGSVTVIGYTVVPWADRKLTSRSTIDSRAIWLDIQCVQD